MQSSDSLAYEHDSVADGTPAADATAARRPQQPPAAVVLKRTISTSWWTEERIEKLTELWNAGSSAAIVAAALHTGRNAVLGKVHRLGLSNRLVVKVAKPIRSTDRALSARNRDDRPVFKSREIKPRLGFPHRQARPALVPIISVVTGAFVTTRKSQPPIAEMTKNQLRAMLTQALHNTAKLAIVP